MQFVKLKCGFMEIGLRNLKVRRIFLSLGLRTVISFFRLFAFWDNTGDTETLIVCSHGLIKKTNKIPKQDIEKTKMTKEKYFKGLL